MKKTLLLLLSVLSFGLSASHIKGGQLYWDALGSNSYKVYLELYPECSSPTPPSTTPVVIDGSNVNLNFVSQTFVASSCTTCTGNEHVVWLYEATVNNIVVPPAIGYSTFSWTSCCRTFSANLVGAPSIGFESRMYPAGQNKSSARIDPEFLMSTYNGKRSFLYVENPSFDSVFVDHAPSGYVANGQFVPATYSSGFSATNPTSANDFLSPDGYFESGSSTSGMYFVSFKSKAFTQQGIPTSDVQIEFAINPIGSSSGTNPPTQSVIPVQGYGAWTTSDSIVYTTTASPGDSVKVEFQSYDMDLDANFLPEQITAQLEMAATIPGNPVLTPVAPQSGLTSSMTNNTIFSWEVPQNINPGVYHFAVRVFDNHCPNPGHSMRMLKVVIPNNNLDVDTFGICTNSFVQLVAPTSGGTYSWSPSTGLSSANTAVTIASPSTTTTYTVSVDGVARGQYTVEVNQPITPVVTLSSGGQLELSNASSFDAFAFLYYYIPFSFNTSPITVSVPGLYHAVGLNGGCFSLSDSVMVTQDSLATSLLVNQPVDTSEFVVFDHQSSYQMEIAVGGFDATLEVLQIIIPGAEMTGKTGNVRLEVTHYDGTVYSVNATPYGGHSLAFYMPAPVVFFESGQSNLELIVDSGSVSLPLVQDEAFPYFFGDLGRVLSVNGSLQGAALTDDIIPFVLRGSWSVGLEEVAADLVVYPQPAKDEIRIDGLIDNTHFSLVDLNGRTLKEGILSTDGRIDVAEFSNGVYVLNLVDGNYSTSLQIIVQH
ncbi:T9SS type A sorting domain-containing protein [Phaeocystidibacter marisrubri]|uniref:T9SS type A sorting domain-containing protein n=1 Tax=Phaeocystidibacter marisrubri TaxID=1577780 RepID=A0A6L3ZCK9_9FLAO|nr:T9SS type A sorting domain-containing protein [Phaeocystidibacter marisrubri]KAB2815177.1 T9SS type A sorting domain-containing protein [Phaeocystidibacter marisrubri]GGH70729.1 hypothetical protein GCM10011318_13030 [Phaeocystidibacter marisrubri]